MSAHNFYQSNQPIDWLNAFWQIVDHFLSALEPDLRAPAGLVKHTKAMLCCLSRVDPQCETSVGSCVGSYFTRV